ncbi:MAG: hypothetical protein DDT28_01193 [Dehalococcoidia bacterium]|nr:hypothetical protein [Chloroflexota bacterium]
MFEKKVQGSKFKGQSSRSGREGDSRAKRLQSKASPDSRLQTSWGQVEVLLGTTVVILAISALCILFFPTVQDFMVGNSLWNGLADFTREHTALTIDSFDQLPELPQGKVLLSIPDLPHGEEELARLREFVTQGGRLVLMDDFGHGNKVLEYLGLEVRFSEQILLDPLFSHRNPRLPRITDFSPEVKEAGVESVVLNHATALTGVGPGEVLAWSSEHSFLDLDGDGSWGRAEPKGPLPVAARFRVGQGEVILVSDPSILINSMVRMEDNRAFLGYLTEGIEPGGILVDQLHLEKSPLDQSRLTLVSARELFSQPPLLLGLIAVIFVGLSRYFLWRNRVLGIST